MNSPTDSVHPPRLAVWLVVLFAPDEHAESILGDLIEEFGALTSKSGITAARSWFWRQAAKTIAHLAAAGVRAAPWQTAASVAGGFLLMLFGSRFAAQATVALCEYYGIGGFYGSELGMWHLGLVVTPYTVWIVRGLSLLHVLLGALVGVVVATASRGREMTATIALGSFLIVVSFVQGVFLAGARTGGVFRLLALTWAYVISVAVIAVAIVAGGAIVRRRRSASASRASIARPSAS